MLIAAFIVLGAAALLGSVLGTVHLRAEGTMVVPWPLGAFHGLLGVTGLGCLLVAMRGPPQGAAQGTESFELISVALIAAAAIFAAGFVAKLIFTGRRAGILIAIHAGLAVSGFVVLLAYILAGQ